MVTIVATHFLFTGGGYLALHGYLLGYLGLVSAPYGIAQRPLWYRSFLCRETWQKLTLKKHQEIKEITTNLKASQSHPKRCFAHMALTGCQRPKSNSCIHCQLMSTVFFQTPDFLIADSEHLCGWKPWPNSQVSNLEQSTRSHVKSRKSMPAATVDLLEFLA